MTLPFDSTLGRNRRSLKPGSPARTDGYAPIADYAAVGDGRTVALIARDGSVDWLCLPDLDSPAVFGALLDARRGGRATLEPECPYGARRRYLRGTNVLETTFSTVDGVVRVTDAMALPGTHLAPSSELVRRIEGLSGRVPMRWSVEPRFGYGLRTTRLAWRGAVPVATAGNEALAVCAWDARPTPHRRWGRLRTLRDPPGSPGATGAVWGVPRAARPARTGPGRGAPRRHGGAVEALGRPRGL